MFSLEKSGLVGIEPAETFTKEEEKTFSFRFLPCLIFTFLEC